MKFDYRARPLAKRGFRVFPIFGVSPFGCRCGKKDCSNIGKHPIIRGWKELASSNEADVLAWSEQYPSANVGIATGHGLLVVDVDNPNCAVAREIVPLLPETLTATTGKGWHHFYSVPIDTALGANVFNGLDVRYTGAYVVGAGSTHRSGRKYAWANDKPIEMLPDEVIQRLVELKGNRGNTPRQPIEGEGVHSYYWGVGIRRNKLMAYASNLQYQGIYTDAQIAGSTRDENLRRCKPPLEQEEVDGIVRHILSKPKGRK